jgi:hypothetical protein
MLQSVPCKDRREVTMASDPPVLVTYYVGYKIYRGSGGLYYASINGNRKTGYHTSVIGVKQEIEANA